MTVFLFDPSYRDQFQPFSSTRPVSDFRLGILTVRESWARICGVEPRLLAPGYLLDRPQASGPTDQPDEGECLFINAACPPDEALWRELDKLKNFEALCSGDRVVGAKWPIRTSASPAGWPLVPALRGPITWPFPDTRSALEALNLSFLYHACGHPVLEYPWEYVQYNEAAIRRDFLLLTRGRKSAPIPAGNTVFDRDNVFVEEGARISCSVLNAATGPIYLGPGTQVMEGCLLRGPFALCEGSVLKMGTKVYGATTLGPHCVGGGEIKNSILMGYSNKAHDGYLGDALVGAWCNLGAGTSASNVRNNAGDVGVWIPGLGRAVQSGQKAGLFMGDYSRCAIQTAFNTGTVVGVCCNVFGPSPCPKYVPDFSWGDTRYAWDKVLRDIDRWKMWKGLRLEEKEIRILAHIFAP